MSLTASQTEPSLSHKKREAVDWFRNLRDEICTVFEALEDSGNRADGEAGRFKRKTWQRDGGGGGEMRGVCRTRGVHERACIAFCVRTDTMVGHVDCDDLLHLNMVAISFLVSVRTREGPARSWRARGGSTLLNRTKCVQSEVTALHVITYLLSWWTLSPQRS